MLWALKFCVCTAVDMANKVFYARLHHCGRLVPICENVPKVRHRAMGCPYRPPSLPLLKPAGHGAPRRAQRKRTRPLRRPAHPSGWLRCAPACAVEGGAAPAADRSRVRRRLVLRAPLPQGAAAGSREPWALAASALERWHHDRTCVKVSTFIR